MPPIFIQPEILEVPDDLAAIQADLMEHLDDSDDDLDVGDDYGCDKAAEEAAVPAITLVTPTESGEESDDDIVDIDGDIEAVDDDNGIEYCIEHLYKKWGKARFDLMCDQLGDEKVLELVMGKSQISAKDHAKLLIRNELRLTK
jgi:hypothetical protein